MGLPLLCALAAEAVGASMFIAAFVAGLAVQIRYPAAGKHSVEFTEEWGQLLNLAIFLLFGVVVASNWHAVNLPMLSYAAFSLTVARMVPVALALVGTGLGWRTVAFMGWFGPRGLASIVLAVIFLEADLHLAGEDTIRLTVMATVALSIFAHGLTAKPGIDRYAAAVSSHEA